MLFNDQQYNYLGSGENAKFIPSTLTMVSSIIENGNQDFSLIAENKWLGVWLFHQYYYPIE